MARRKKSSQKTQTVWEQSKSNVISGVLALALIVVGFVIFNTFANHSTSSENPKPKQVSKSSINLKNQKLSTAEKNSSKKQSSNSKSTALVYVVAKGDNLSRISKSYYNDPEKWTVIAAENQLANPQVIHVGDQLKIPDLQKQTSSIATSQTNQASSSKSTAVNPKTYTVVEGDSLWTISQHFYSGDGYQWFKIRDANSTKVGLLANGRPLITPGTILTIPPA